MQILRATLLEFAKTADCDFLCTKLAFQKVSINFGQKSSQEILKHQTLLDGVLAHSKRAVSFSFKNCSGFLRYLVLLQNSEEFTNWFNRVVLKNRC